MRTFNLFLPIAGIASLLTGTTPAQDANAPTTNVPSTNPPLTKLEAFDAKAETVLIKGSAPVGSVLARTATVVVRLRESADAGAGRKEHGLAITLQHSTQVQDTTVIDYDELETLLNGIDLISRVDHTVTTLPSFEVSYKTRGQFRVFIYTSNNRPGTLQFALHDGRLGKPWVLLTSGQLAEFKNLIQQGKSKLDLLRAGN